ncbi:unnamed protein product [Eruca vesicaria subsp. sativa]|uniref:Uncharacterized protein n=1 Tax=Eruca vesicaria subsp. sativa TaxID=29727 RepID=A0ABC8M5F5_ERUVS|nr:unnamed protein product [Eruca vesicaria subsp. sativa]
MVENGEGEEAGSMPHGVTGDESVGPIPFHVIKFDTLKVAIFGLIERALYFPNFATADSGTFVSASEESDGALEFVEKKIAKATMIRRTHGKIDSFLLYLSDVEEGMKPCFLLRLRFTGVSM